MMALPILGLVPGLLWLLYFYRRAGHNPRSFANVGRVFLWGCACTIPTFIVENVTGAGLRQETLVRSAEASFLLIGPIEEFFKLVAVWISIYRRSDFQEPNDGIVYAATAALGFASVENTIYMGLLGPAIVVPRALFATPAHVMFASMWGYSMGLARFRREGELADHSKRVPHSGLVAWVVQFSCRGLSRGCYALPDPSDGVHGLAHEPQNSGIS